MDHRKQLKFVVFFFFLTARDFGNPAPLVVNTWHFLNATARAWELLLQNESAVATLEAGCTVCEVLQCDHSVGYGGSPDEHGETTLDALIFDGATMNMGAVGGIRDVKSAISVARHVLENTKHSFVVGSLATEFAVEVGFQKDSLATNFSKTQWSDWTENKCQPNYWLNVEPDPKTSCGPYQPISENSAHYNYNKNPAKMTDIHPGNHDTIGMIVIDGANNIVAGTSTNGLNHKIPGRVGDSPIPGAGAYADNEVGAAVGTGDGDVMMRFLPSFLAVEEMRRGSTPTEAARVAILRIKAKYPDFMGAIIAVNKDGVYGAACNGIEQFPFSVASPETRRPVLESVDCVKNCIARAGFETIFYVILAISWALREYYSPL